nr:putative zinc finger, CCHC-type [Tanacetum cinerariifolium]
MADNRTMAQMLQAPIEGYEDAIVVPPINANNFELKQTLINLVQSNQFTGRQDPHNHLRFFNKDLEQIHEDDLEAMDMRWQLSLLSIRTKRYFQKTGKKIFINANDTAGYEHAAMNL